MPTGMDAILGAGAQAAGEATMSSFGDFLASKALMMPNIDTGILSGLSGLGGKAWDFLGSEQTANAIGTAGNLFSGFNKYKQGKDFGKILKSQEARSADAYARDKEADSKRQLLTF